MRAIVPVLLAVPLSSAACGKKHSSDNSGDSTTENPTTSASDGSTSIDETSATSQIIIDRATTSGTYRDVIGLNKAPRGTDSQALGANKYEISQLYKIIGVSTVRTLDSYFDICEVYTDDTVTNATNNQTLTNCVNTQGTHATWASNNSGANLGNGIKYNFTTVDSGLDAIYNSGASIYYRMGENNNGPNDTTDFSGWATVGTNIYKHISGQGGGFGNTPSHTVTTNYIELTNEPDGSFWMGSQSNYFSLYNTAFDTVRAVAPASVKIGGPAFTTNFQTHLGISSNPAANFVSSVGSSRLDFISTHVYGSCESATLSEMINNISFLRSYMNSNGLSTKPIIVSEWNIGLNCSSETSFHSARAQSFNGAMMAMMQDSSLNIEKAMIYGGFGNMAFFTVDQSNPGTVTIYPGAWAMRAHMQLAGGTLLSLKVCDKSNANCQSGTGMINAEIIGSAVASGSQVKVTLSNDSAAAKTTALHIQNWQGSTSPSATVKSYPASPVTLAAPSASGTYTVTSDGANTMLSSSETTTSVATGYTNGTVAVVVSIPAQSTILLTIQ